MCFESTLPYVQCSFYQPPKKSECFFLHLFLSTKRLHPFLDVLFLNVAISIHCAKQQLEASYTGGDMRQEGASPYCHLALGCAGRWVTRCGACWRNILPVSSNVGWKIPYQWRFLVRKITDVYGPFSNALITEGYPVVRERFGARVRHIPNIYSL